MSMRRENYGERRIIEDASGCLCGLEKALKQAIEERKTGPNPDLDIFPEALEHVSKAIDLISGYLRRL